ncbi:COG4223 family protein [Aureimonas leprariae]|uniref:Inner membrane protein n=1 Tax=Plantimonas leprariae TaxID=2615207 RepID=A0A7V7PRN2_9HYPH|nr:hypothetical protein [Aureimonas leprariae]KAB0681433.1 hypothetical protein F6X38_06000 [Aureimonas leprariae]
MSMPPRRSRPRKPGETIDLTAQRIENEPLEPQTADAPGKGEPEDVAADPESRLADEASVAPAGPDDTISRAESGVPSVEESGIAALGEPEPGDRNAPPAADGTVREPDADAAIANLAADGSRPDEAVPPEVSDAERRADRDATADELDAEAILGSDGPHAAVPPPPEHDYHQTAPHGSGGGGAGLGTVIGAGLLGAVLALLIGGGLQYAGVLPAARGVDTAELTRDFARSGDVQQLATDLNTVRTDVGQLQSTLSAGGAGGPPGPSGADFAALADRFNGLEGRLNALTSGTEQGSGGAAAPAIDPGLVQGATDTANGARDAANQAKQAADGAGAQAAEARQTAQTAAQAAGTAQQAADVAQQAANGAQQAANGAMEAAKTNGAAIEDIRNRIGAVEEAGRRGATAVSAANLKAAVDRGGPFMAELETFARTAGPSPAVDSLRNYAAAGVPSLATLQADWPDARTAVLAALHPADPNAGVGSQILSGFNSLVAVRPSASAASGSGGGDGTDAAVATLDAKMEAGDLDGWLAGWQALPEAGRNAATAFRDRVEARARSESVIGEALNGAVNSIGNPN